MVANGLINLKDNSEKELSGVKYITNNYINIKSKYIFY
ncbi:MAG: hypothetical protein HWQ41_25845 [Nostoc sp. NOS(2021)]|nr:hypothetical protein [Nostoc sp. NOS(2021)]